MNPDIFEALIASSMFEKFPMETQELVSSIMLMPAKTVSAGEEMEIEGTSPEVVMAAKGASPEVETIKVLKEVRKSLRTPRPRPTPTKEGPKSKKDTHEAQQPVKASPKKHP